MPHFYFKLINDLEVEDPEGKELDSLAAARQQAAAYARDMAAEEVRQGKVHLNHRIIIQDEDRQPLLTVRLRDAFAIHY